MESSERPPKVYHMKGYNSVDSETDKDSLSTTKEVRQYVEQSSFLNWYIKELTIAKRGVHRDLVKTRYDSIHWALVLEYLVGFTVNETFFYRSEVNKLAFTDNKAPEGFNPTGSIAFVGSFEGEDIVVARILYQGRPTVYSRREGKLLSLQRIITRENMSGIKAVKRLYYYYDVSLEIKAEKPELDISQTGFWTWLGYQTIFWIPKGIELGDEGQVINVRGEPVVPSEVLGR